MKTVLLITALTFPIPAVAGGGVQTIITNCLDANEKYGQVRFIVCSPYHIAAIKEKYSNSKIYYFKDEVLCGVTGVTLHCIWKARRMLRSIKKKLPFSKKIQSDSDLSSFLIYQYCHIAKKEKVDVIVLENVRDKQTKMYSPLEKYVGSENFYTHIHWTHSGLPEELQAVPNSISISEYVKNEWIKAAPNLGKHYVLYNCINTELFSAPHIDREAIRRKLGISEKDIVVIFCGRFSPVKGVAELLDAFGIIEKKEIKLLLIGSANYASPESTDFSNDVVNRANQMKNVIYPGYIPNEILYKYYGASDIAVVPSIWQEGCGLVAVESMAAGLPLIITQSGGMVEYVTDECAIKLPIDENLPYNLAKSILELSENSALRKQMSGAGQKRAKLYSPKNYYNDFLNIINCE